MCILVFDQTIHLSFKTPIPSGVSNDAILAILHDPVTMITLNPLVISQKLTSAPGVTPAVYSITDKLPIGTTTYTASFTNTATGMSSTVDASLGLKTTGVWSIVQGDSGMVLDEEVDVTGNRLVVPFVKGQIESSHQELHKALIAKVSAGGSSA